MRRFIEIQHTFVDALLSIPGMDDFSLRSSLLQGLPSAPLVRSQAMPRLDLNNIISGLAQLGRLDDQGGTRPLIVVAENALDYLPATGDVSKKLHDVIAELTMYYGGDIQPEPQPLPPEQQEALIFGPEGDNRLPLQFVEKALLVSKSVARLRVPRLFNGKPDARGGYGTGWLIAPGLLITNHHVIEARFPHSGEKPAQREDFLAQATQMDIWFDYYSEAGKYLSCRGATVVADNRNLDYAILQLAQPQKVAKRSPLRLALTPPPFQRKDRLNIVQHSGGGPLQYAIRNNFFVQIGSSPELIRYQTDTEGGASGSPVCDDSWQVVALHHASRPVPKTLPPQESIDGTLKAVSVLNEAIILAAIINNLPPSLKQRILDGQTLLNGNKG